MKSFFEYLETSTPKERERIAEELKDLYRGAVDDENEQHASLRMNPRSHNARKKYYEAVQVLGTIMDIFDILHIVDYDEELFEFANEE